jgi:hypothetical protein
MAIRWTCHIGLLALVAIALSGVFFCLKDWLSPSITLHEQTNTGRVGDIARSDRTQLENRWNLELQPDMTEAQFMDTIGATAEELMCSSMRTVVKAYRIEDDPNSMVVATFRRKHRSLFLFKWEIHGWYPEGYFEAKGRVV